MTMFSHEARPYEILVAIRDHLRADAALKTTLRATSKNTIKDRVYLADEDYSRDDWTVGYPGSRLVLVPTSTLWRIETPLTSPQPLNFLARAETNNFLDGAFTPAVRIGAIQAHVNRLLMRYVPGVTDHARVSRPLYLFSTGTVLPLWDTDRSVWFRSAEWRTEVINA